MSKEEKKETSESLAQKQVLLDSLTNLIGTTVSIPKYKDHKEGAPMTGSVELSCLTAVEVEIVKTSLFKLIKILTVENGVPAEIPDTVQRVKEDVEETSENLTKV